MELNHQNTNNTYLNQTGMLNVGYHQIYWEDWGNPAAKTPIIYLHGGPGTGFEVTYRELFDPTVHRVIFHSQRGAGKSIPYADIHENTTQHLISDIESLCEHLGLKEIYVTGGSWGSALSLFYVLAHPERVKKFVIWSVFTGTQFEVDFVNEGYARYYFPEEWERFIALVPEDHRQNGNAVMRYYAEKIHGSDEVEAKKYADEWTLWEITLCSIYYNKSELKKEIMGDDGNLSIARLETHYFSNHCFVPEGYVADNLPKIKHIPCVAIQGRFDMCTPPIAVYQLSKQYGDCMALKFVNSEHLQSDQPLGDALRETFKTEF